MTAQIIAKHPHLSIIEGKVKTTSRDVAEFFDKRHDTVLRGIKQLDCPPEFRLRNFAESSYSNEQSKNQPMVEMTRDGFVFLAMGFTGKNAAQFKVAYIEAFNQMEAKLLTEQRMPSNLVKMADYISRTVKEIHSGDVYPIDVSELDSYINSIEESSQAIHEAVNNMDMMTSMLRQSLQRFKPGPDLVLD